MYAGEVSQWTATIIERLGRVREFRLAREADPDLLARVGAVKRFQHARFARDYAALLADPRYAGAARFFLEELYGPEDFAARDAEFARVIPWMARLLPEDVMRMVADLIQLHALTEELDQQMGAAIGSSDLDERSYRAAWRRVGRRVDRDRQLALLLAVGGELERHTHSRVLATTLRLMRRPAQAAGLGRLQSFLETGLSAFTSMRGAREFLQAIELNEAKTIDALFAEK
ncbi:MAG TPA: hypothetical protein VLE94_15695 [Burkholderiaceae bacterium]|nr:hypothetical protein [Burkholderiaceae bacterium]